MFVFLSLTLYNYYLVNKKIRLLFLSNIFFVVSILTSEVGLIVLLLTPVCAFMQQVSFKKIITSSLFYVLTACSYLSYTFWLRSHVDKHEAYVGLTTNINFHAMRDLFYKQIFASFPMSNIFGKRGLPNIFLHQLTDVKNLIGIVLILIFSIVVYIKYANKNSKTVNIFPYRFLLLSLGLIAFPAIFILPSVKYQSEVQWGVGYLPVYFQNFGSATFLYILIQWTLDNHRRFFKYVSAFLFSVAVSGICVAFLFNNALIKASSFNKSFPATVFYNKINDQCHVSGH